MSRNGFEKFRFIDMKGDMFDCMLCRLVANIPHTCHACGVIFCHGCIRNYNEEIGIKGCPNCEKDNIHPILGVLEEAYYKLQIQCQFCKELSVMNKIDEHESQCPFNNLPKPNCHNFDICQQKAANEDGFCSHSCRLLLKIKNNFNSNAQINLDEAYKDVKEFCKTTNVHL